ncbi:MAG: LarC family nickel insertion protein [Clostridiales bacterium]|nr:LarC family nickel insertion protein [Clostridiales bacterium]
MEVLYFNCENGISGDMMLKALMDLSDCGEQIKAAMKEADFKSGFDDHHHDSEGHHGRSYEEVQRLIGASGFSLRAKEVAENIYAYIADAEAKVHGATLETVHFHEVGRDEAIKNALGIGMAMEDIAPDLTVTSPICDGRGYILCSHGRIPVPVPAVKALMEKSSFEFRTADIDTEMVTPSGLASLMGIGAEPDSNVKGLADALEGIDETAPSVIIMKHTEATGSRSTGRGGLKAYILKIATDTTDVISTVATEKIIDEVE